MAAESRPETQREHDLGKIISSGSDKAMALGGSVLEAVLGQFNR